MKNLKTHLTDFLANVLAKVIVLMILISAILAGALDAEAVQAAMHRLDELLSWSGAVVPSNP